METDKQDELTDDMVALFDIKPTADEAAIIDRMVKASRMSMADALGYETGEG